ncbi:hypothetical protein GGR50DRAFT_677330 [Xylaria sp. CBS 124048]|nr:hypothetical protein GGR50DRAFT_677330 [Xylaria sp. CBS 124048]
MPSLSSFFLLLSAASSTLAGVLPTVPETPLAHARYAWDITQYQAGLSHGNPATPITSWYTFTITGPPSGHPSSPSTYIPPFTASCTGIGSGFPLASVYVPCILSSSSSANSSTTTTTTITTNSTIIAVLARVVPPLDINNAQAHIGISYIFQSISQSQNRQNNYSAIAVTDWARERPPYNFTLVPVEVL